MVDDYSFFLVFIVVLVFGGFLLGIRWHDWHIKRQFTIITTSGTLITLEREHEPPMQALEREQLSGVMVTAIESFSPDAGRIENLVAKVLHWQRLYEAMRALKYNEFKKKLEELL